MTTKEDQMVIEQNVNSSLHLHCFDFYRGMYRRDLSGIHGFQRFDFRLYDVHQNCLRYHNEQ